MSDKVEVTKLPKTSVKMPPINGPSLRERTADILSIISPRKTATLQFVRKRHIQSTKTTETKKKRKKSEEILVEQSIFIANDDTSLVEMNYIADSDADLNRNSGNSADTSLENNAESGILKAGLVVSPLCKTDSGKGIAQHRMPYPTRKWTIEEDRKILYIHKENGPDLNLTLASVQSELPEIPVDALRQRLAFLLRLLQRMESTGSKQT